MIHRNVSTDGANDLPNIFSQLKLVVFDWDGTLLDSTGAITASIQDAASDCGLPVPTRQNASQVIGLALAQALTIAVPQVSTEQLPRLIERYKHHYLQRDASLHPFEGITDLLNQLAALGVPMAIATGKSNLGLMRALDHLKWTGRFVATRCADQGEPKPHPWMLLDICNELGVAPHEALMIGDTTHDLGLAKNAGCPSVGVTYGAHSDLDFDYFTPVAVFSDVSSLSSWIVSGFAARNQLSSTNAAPTEVGGLGVVIGDSDDLADRGFGFRFSMPDGRPAFAIRYDGEIRGYINECRHQPTELDWNFGHFLDADQTYIVCASHGALYEPLSGICIGGPCRGKALEKVRVVEHDGKIILKDDFI
jgi:phosphoglycolate phosphatase